MQTFLPYSDFKQTAQCLDYRRLGKQRVEAKQILMALLNLTNSKAWRNHPATKMWRGHEGALAKYAYTICDEWIQRGYKDSLKDFFHQYMSTLDTTNPDWLGDEELHSSHRSNLLRKDSNYYSKYNWSEPDNLPYKWPV